jgi:hypothetical protein
MVEESKVSISTTFVQLEAGEVSIVCALPPFMLPRQYAALMGKSERAVKKDLQDGEIARYQTTKGGLVYVNVLKEIEKAKNAKAY